MHSWYGTLILRNAYNAAEFLDLASYKNVVRWAEEIAERPLQRVQIIKGWVENASGK